MPFTSLNVVLKENLQPGTMLSVPYPEGKGKNHFFAGSDHKLSVGATFFRYPRDFMLTFGDDRLILHWNHERTMPAGTVMHFMIDEPAADYHRNTKLDIAIQGVVASPIYLVNLGTPQAADEEFFFSGAHARLGPIQLEQKIPDQPRNVTLSTNHDNSHAIFTVEGQDLYGQRMIEQIIGPRPNQPTAGKKAFAAVTRVEPNQPCRDIVHIGTGDIFGLPVFLPSEGFVMSQIVGGQAVTGGRVVPGDTDVPTATSGDRRGTYTMPAGMQPNGRLLIQLLLSLINPGNIGTPDYEG